MSGSNKSAVTLGAHLAAIRSDRKLTLRQVEEATGKEVSNAYLSQIENDKVGSPSPHVLYALAELYRVDYTHLMELAGYLRAPAQHAAGERHGRAATFAEINLTDDEEAELLRFLKFLRAQKDDN
jgi:transcriptional regulator with XRE-family HTH domain